MRANPATPTPRHGECSNSATRTAEQRSPFLRIIRSGFGTITSTGSPKPARSTPRNVAADLPVMTEPSGTVNAAAAHFSTWVRGVVGMV